MLYKGARQSQTPADPKAAVFRQDNQANNLESRTVGCTAAGNGILRDVLAVASTIYECTITIAHRTWPLAQITGVLRINRCDRCDVMVPAIRCPGESAAC
jgi:hypothetical protein